MKVEEKNIVVWDCGSGHNHHTKSAATNCLKKQEAPARKLLEKRIRKQRNLHMATQFLGGLSYVQVAQEAGISTGQAKYLIEHLIRRAQYYAIGPQGGAEFVPQTPTECRKDAAYWTQYLQIVTGEVL